jgi:hypothetical protein
MKGQAEISLNGNKVKLSFKFGTYEDFQEYVLSLGDVSLEKAMEEFKHLRVLMSLMSEYAGNKVSADEFKQLDFSEVGIVTELIRSSMETISMGKPKRVK